MALSKAQKEERELARIEAEYRKNFMVESGIQMPELPPGVELPRSLDDEVE